MKGSKMVIIKAVKDESKVEQIFESYLVAKEFILEREKEGYVCLIENYPQFTSYEELTNALHSPGETNVSHN
jgi:hypothetical protein